MDREIVLQWDSNGKEQRTMREEPFRNIKQESVNVLEINPPVI